MESLRLAELLADIDIALDAGEFERAVGLIDANVTELPNPGPLQIRLADAAVAMDHTAQALPVYRRALRHLSRRGFPTESLTALIKLRDAAGALSGANADAAENSVDEAIDEWTRLFCRGSDRVDTDTRIRPLPGSDDITLEPAELESSAEQRLDELINQPGEEPPQDVPADNLPAVPLISDLPPEVGQRVCRHLVHERYDDIEPVFEEDFPDGGLVWTVSPNVTLGDESPEHRLQPGTLLGLNALGVTPRDPGRRAYGRKGTELLRWPADARESLQQGIEGLQEFLGQYHRHAVIDRLMSTHPLFETVDIDRRDDLLQLLEPVRVPGGTTVVTQGEPSDGIYLVIDGEVDIVRNEEDWSANIATLGPGGLFGEVGVVSDRDPVASSRMKTDGYLLMLPARRFSQAAGNFPKLAKYVVNKARARIEEVESTSEAAELTEVAEPEEVESEPPDIDDADPSGEA